MRLRRLINRGSAISLSLALLAICASEAHAQGGGAGGGGGGGGGGGAGGGGGGASTATATQAGGGYTGGGSSSSGFTGSTGMSAAQRNAGGTATLAPTTGNFLQQTYYSPYLAGLVNTNGQALTGVNSSFGQPGYTTVYSTATSSSSGTGTATGGTGGVIASTMISGGVGFGYNTYGLGRTYNYVAVPGDTLPPVVHSNPVLRATIEDALQRSTTFKPLAPLQVAVNDSEVILDGTVASAREKRIIEGMIRMTPGVRSVVNRLEIAERLPAPKVGSAGGGP